jgi:hypothetical protein
MKIRFWLFALSFLLVASSFAHAQSVPIRVVATCGAETIPTGSPTWLRVSAAGLLCASTVGGGGGGPATIADGADVGEGATTATAATAGGTGSVNAKLRLVTTQLATINTTLGTPMQATGGAVQANAGTNLNTSLLALESGGNLASVVTQLGAVTASPTANTIADRLKTINTTLGTPLQAGGTVGQASQYPAGAVPITASNTGTTGATTATLAGTLSKTTYICGFVITADATAVAVGTATVTGTVTGTLSFIQGAFAATTGASTLNVPMMPCVPASAQNTGIAVNSIAAGTGGNTAVAAWGFQL